ncbi:MAG: phosphatase PAP2 family protein [Chloroflexota bacterium]|nr:phosphatase PAP2 family protein [Chloroflexota bacterium]MDE2885285.1 phosphatase PAP2 family protein [Chloroflexota bacterium]
MDSAIVLFLNAGVGNVAPFDSLMKVLVSDYFVPVTGSLALVSLWMTGTHETRPLNQVTTIVAAAAIGCANAITTIINNVVERPRPFVDNDLATGLFYSPTDPSFPSNTASVGFALATAVFLRHRRLGGVLYALAFCWGFARVYAGVHYPTDVLAGAAIGVVAALAMAALFRVLAFVPRYALRWLRLLYVA